MLQLQSFKLLFAVQPRGASNCAMNMIPIFALMLAPNPPLPISPTCRCAILAASPPSASSRMSNDPGSDASQSYADVRESGKRWAGIVGERVMEESGQPREVVAFAIKQAVEAEQEHRDEMTAKSPLMCNRFGECKSING
jgi:hypothetical protein